MAELNQIFLGEIASVQNYGAFVRIPNCKQQGLIHKSQVSSARVDEVGDVLQRGERVWCKVINVGEDGKIGLSMKHVDQGSGRDLDPNGVELQMDEQRRKKLVPGQKKAIELQAVLNTTCSKCGTRGHLATNCFVAPNGKKYELIPEIEDEAEVPVPAREENDPTKEEKKTKVKKPKKRKKSKKSRQRSDGSSDEDEDEENDNEESGERKRKKRKKKHSKESKKKKRKHSESSSDGDSSDSPDNRDTKSRRECNDKKAKKCKHSRSKHSD